MGSEEGGNGTSCREPVSGEPVHTVPCAPCLPLDSHRIYAGTSVRIPLKPGYKATFTVKVRDKVSTAAFE